MSTRVIKRTHDPLETLERMLQKTTLTTQRVSHRNIIGLGDQLLSLTKSDDREDRQKAIDDAVAAAEDRATRELKAALRRLRQEKDQERQRALDKQKWYFERLAQRVSEQRDRAEEERMKEVSKKLQREKGEALMAQWQECQRLQQEAIQAACHALRKQLRNEFAVEKEQAIAEALKAAREGFKRREEEVAARTRQECQEEARREAERVARAHQAQMDHLTLQYNVLQQKYTKEMEHKQRVESDFRALQEDYKKFMDYTDGAENVNKDQPVKFEGNTYLNYPSEVTRNSMDLVDEDNEEPAQRSNEVRVRFKTTEQNGMILFQNRGESVRGDYLALAVVRGRMEFSYNLGEQNEDNLHILRSKVDVTDGKWHTAVARRNLQDGSLEVDGEAPVKSASGSGSSQLDTDGEVWVGGRSSLPRGLPQEYYEGFTGCIQDISINNEELHLVDHRNGHSSTITFCS